MTFDTKKLDARRFSFEAIEIDLDINDPSLDDTFAFQADSYGTPKTTDNAAAYTGVDFRAYRYSDQQLFGVDHFPAIDLKVASTPPKIEPGKSIGFRAGGSVTMNDFIDGDEFALPAPYDDRRVRGSHFTKLFARNHLRNRRIKRIRGYDPFDYSASNTRVENYIIDSYSGPDKNGKVKFSMVDELILVETKQAKAPEINKGELSATLTIGGTALSFTSPITDEYGAVTDTGYLIIEKEIMFYTVDSATTMTVGRGAFGTTAKEHAAGETIQKVIVYNDVNIIDIFTDIITNYTKIPASYIPTADWAALKAGDLADYNLTTQIFNPTSVKKLFNILIAHAGLSMYVDVVAQKLVIVTSPDFATPVITFNEGEHIIRGSLDVKRDDKSQITRQTIHWDKADSTEDDNEQNFTKKIQVIDGVIEGDADESVVSEGEPLISPWLINSLEDNLLAASFAQRTVNRFSEVPIQVKFEVDQRYIDTVAGGNMWLGSIFNLESSKIVDGGLNIITKTFQCTSIMEARENQVWTIEGLSYVAAAPPNADLFISEDKVDYLLTDELTTDEAREYVVVVNSGVTISSSSTSIKAFTQGTFFAGATLKLIILGRIIGAGGGGGTGSTASPAGIGCTLGTTGSGTNGGDALDLSTDTIIDNGFGLIGAGGGGGSGRLGSCTLSPDRAVGGAGGGGGQGQAGGNGGTGGIGDSANGFDGPDGTIAAPGSNGGTLGEDGGSEGGGTGGLAGVAINKNGNTVTIIAGNNSEQIKGAII